MSQSERPYWMQIQILKENIEKLLLEKRVLRFSNADIEKREIEKRDLYVIRNTLQFLKEENRLKNTYELPIAEKLTAAKLYSSKTDRRSVKIPIVVIVMLVLCALTVFSAAGSWIDVNGNTFNIWNVIESYEHMDFIINVSTTEGILEVLLMLGVCLQWGSVILYIALFIRLCFRKNTELPYAYMLIIMITFVVFGVSALLITNGLPAETGGSQFANSGLTLNAWASLALACGVSIIYYKRYEISKIFPDSYRKWKIITKECPVTNYYPWKDIRFLSAILTQDKNVNIAVSYASFGENSNMGEEIIANTNILREEEIIANTDIIIKAGGILYMVSGCDLEINYGECVGMTNKLVIERMKFNINEVEDVKIIINSIGYAGEAVVLEPRVYAESGMDSYELLQYRNKTSFVTAICENRKVKNGWVCRCGLYHKDSEKQCEKCFDICPQQFRQLQTGF